jgi:hypothetical protein
LHRDISADATNAHDRARCHRDDGVAVVDRAGRAIDLSELVARILSPNVEVLHILRQLRRVGRHVGDFSVGYIRRKPTLLHALSRKLLQHLGTGLRGNARVLSQ